MKRELDGIIVAEVAYIFGLLMLLVGSATLDGF